MSLSAKLQQVNNWSVWCDIRGELKQCYIVTAHWPTNGHQRLILRIPSQQLILIILSYVTTHARTNARTNARTHTYNDIYIYYTVGLNIMYMPTFKKNTLGPSFYFGDPVFSNQWGPRALFFYALARTLGIP